MTDEEKAEAFERWGRDQDAIDDSMARCVFERDYVGAWR